MQEGHTAVERADQRDLNRTFRRSGDAPAAVRGPFFGGPAKLFKRSFGSRGRSEGPFGGLISGLGSAGISKSPESPLKSRQGDTQEDPQDPEHRQGNHTGENLNREGLGEKPIGRELVQGS